jgi:hypothetical protein
MIHAVAFGFAVMAFSCTTCTQLMFPRSNRTGFFPLVPMFPVVGDSVITAGSGQRFPGHAGYAGGPGIDAGGRL